MHVPEPPWAGSRGATASARKASRRARRAPCVSPMQGTVLAGRGRRGGRVAAGDLICVVEAMKMENEIVAHADGVVAELAVAPGQQVASGQISCASLRPASE